MDIAEVKAHRYSDLMFGNMFIIWTTKTADPIIVPLGGMW